MQENIDIEELKNDKEFQENLKKLEQEVAENNSLSQAYQLLDAKLAIGADENEINELFNNVVQNAFEQVSNKIAEGGELDLSNPDEWAAARAIYEHAIERFSVNDKKAAQELFLALHYLINHLDVKDAMLVHAAAVGKDYSFDDFFNKLTKVDDKDFNDPMAVFVTDFVQPVDILLEMMKDEVKILQARLEKLKQAQNS